jgi:hypothetical protein
VSQTRENPLLRRIAQNAVTIKLIGGLDNFVLQTRAKYDSFDASRAVTRGANMTSSSYDFCQEPKRMTRADCHSYRKCDLRLV